MQDSLRNPKQTRGKSRKRRSLSRKVRRAVAISCVLLGMLIQVIGITLYGLILVREYEHLASNAAKQVSIAVRHGSGDRHSSHARSRGLRRRGRIACSTGETK